MERAATGTSKSKSYSKTKTQKHVMCPKYSAIEEGRHHQRQQMSDPGWRTIVHSRAFHGRGQLWSERARYHRATTHDAPSACGNAEGSDWPTQSPHGAGSALHSLVHKATSQMRTDTCTGIFQESCVEPSYGCTTYKNPNLSRTD